MKEMYMEDTNRIVVETIDFIEDKLKDYSQLLKVDDSDKLFDILQDMLQEYGNGIYANHN
jgi:hypothetical protein